MVKLGRSPSHRKALLAALVSGLVEQKQITTTLPKARLTRSLAEKMITLGKKGTLAARRQAIATLGSSDIVAEIFTSIAPQYTERHGGYTRIMKLGRRSSDSSEMAIVEWVDLKRELPKAKAKDAVKPAAPAT